MTIFTHLKYVLIFILLTGCDSEVDKFMKEHNCKLTSMNTEKDSIQIFNYTCDSGYWITRKEYY